MHQTSGCDEGIGKSQAIVCAMFINQFNCDVANFAVKTQVIVVF